MTGLLAPFVIAVMFAGQPDVAPRMVEPHQGPVLDCQKRAGQLMKEHEAMLKQNSAVVVCMEVKLPQI